MSVTIEQDLKEILGKIDQKLDGIQKDIVDLKIGQTEIKGELKTLSEKINEINEQVKKPGLHKQRNLSRINFSDSWWLG